MSGAPSPGDVLAGKYRVERVLGQGGMGVVVAARHIQLDELVAVKFLHAVYSAQSDQIARFLREGRAAVKIKSEHVARVSDVGTLENGAPYMVMEFLEGNDLSEILKKEGPLPIIEAVEFLLQACEALAEAHAMGMVHRDLKPANLFLMARSDGSPCVKVLDFGISKLKDGTFDSNLTATNGMMGSPSYMSPEQLSNPRGVDARADVWALGVILHELITGQRPFHADSLPQLVMMLALEPPKTLREVLPDAPEALEQVILKCLEKAADQRYQNIGELARALLPFAPPEAVQSIERITRVLAADNSARRRTTRNPSSSDAAMIDDQSGSHPGAGSGSHPGASSISRPGGGSSSQNSQSGPSTKTDPNGSGAFGAIGMERTLAAGSASTPVPVPVPVYVPHPPGMSTTAVSSMSTNVAAPAQAAVATPEPQKKKGVVFAFAALTAVVVIGGLAVMLTRTSGPTNNAANNPPPPPATVATTAADKPTPHATATATTIAVVEPTATASATASASVAPTAKPTAPQIPATSLPITKPSAVTKPSATAAPANCSPPYTIDAEGHKHYKLECL